LQGILSLGRTPLANALLTNEQLGEDEDTYPLDLAFCSSCWLVQITETVSPEKLFREYVYLSSFSDTMLQHAAALSAQLLDSRRLNAQSLVVEVASNDGYLLQFYKRAGATVLGIEPALNIAGIAEKQHGIPTVREFFSEELSQRLREEGHRADVIHAHNVLAHVSELNGFVRGLRGLIKQNGVIVIEVPYVKDMIDRCEFDTIYHEHLSYFSFTRQRLIHSESRACAHSWWDAARFRGKRKRRNRTFSVQPFERRVVVGCWGYPFLFRLWRKSGTTP